MSPGHWLRISLARKISLLFGTAVLLTIAATLVFPWLQMNALTRQAMLLQAKRVASVAYQSVDLRSHHWDAAQGHLDGHWPAMVRALGLPNTPPRVIPAARAGPGFQSDAVDRLSRNPQQDYYWRIQEEGRTFRFAMGVRDAETAPHPNLLRGVIDVRLPIPQAPAVWNLVVTVLAGASGAVLAILVFYMVTQRLVLSPVLAMRRVADQVAAGNLEVRSPIRSGDEFEEFSNTFNDMLAHLKAAQEEQRKINRSLDIRLGELAETNVALYEANRLKSEFLTNVTHELRTPLVSIIGFAELLRDAWGQPEADQRRLLRYCETILSSARSLLDIINDLLDLAKIEAGKTSLHVSDFSMADLCRDLIDFVRPLADKRDQHLVLHLADDLPPCRSDSGKVKQILYNLLSNAVKFTPPGGSVSLSVCRNADDRFRIDVVDTGPGIPPEQQDSIFEKFRQLDASQTREHEGTGLGLAITRELVHLLGGTILLESSDGSGSTFRVELPMAVGHEEVPRTPIPLT